MNAKLRTAILAVIVGSMGLIQSTAPAQAPSAKDGRNRPKQPDKTGLERKFAESLTGVVLTGTWQVTDQKGLEGKAPLGEAKPDKYTIASVTKVGGDYWTITARIQYADKDVNVPITVRVVWAEDVPIITLDRTDLPLMGSYEARVMIHKGFYAGTWFGTTYGGVMSGQIVKQADDTPGDLKKGETASPKE
ncbi:MAG: hypothetical protein ACE5GE_09520 [Phycisphaerae bacterium]